MFPFGHYGYEYFVRPYFTDGHYLGVCDFVRAGKATSIGDLRNGRLCSVTGAWVPGHMLRYVWGRPVRNDIPYEAVSDRELLELERVVQRLTGGVG